MYANKISETAQIYLQKMRTLLEAKADGMGIREAETLRKVQESLLGDSRTPDPKTGRFVSSTPTPEGCLKRFLSFIEFTDSCWIWKGKKSKRHNPYGHFAIIDEKRMRPHVLSYRLFHGDILPGMEVMHLCQRHACVNPAHIKQATHAENVKHDRTGIHPIRCLNGHDLTLPGAFYQYWAQGKYGKTSQRVCKTCAKNKPKKPYDPAARHQAWLRKKEKLAAKGIEIKTRGPYRNSHASSEEHLSISGKRIEL